MDVIVNRNLELLHPLMRRRVDALVLALEKAKNPLRIFEGYRSPIRQRNLHDSGRGVTKAGAWESAHQYGLAVDFAVPRGGRRDGWTWTVDPAHWRELAVLAAHEGLYVPSPGWDPGHVEHPAFGCIREVCRRFGPLA